MAEKNINKSQLLLKLITHVGRKYQTRIYLVGGSVRDLVRSGQQAISSTIDLDIAVENNYYQIGNELALKLKAKLLHYPEFMTLSLMLKDGRHLDIANTRKEIYPQPAVLPYVEPADIYQDLARRDFTINAMALEISSRPPIVNLSRILDPFGGQKDISVKLIRILHPRSFIDDPTRIFRALRFAIRFDYKLEVKTARLMSTAINNDYLKLLSGERILYELQMIVREPTSQLILKKINNRAVIENIFGVALPTIFFKEHQLLNPEQKLIHLFSYLPPSKFFNFPLTKAIRESALALQKFNLLRSVLRKAEKPSAIYQVLHQFPKPALSILAIIEPPLIQKKIRDYLDYYSQVKIVTNGQILQNLNIKPSPLYTKIMRELVFLKLDGKIKTKTDEMNYVLRKYRS